MKHFSIYKKKWTVVIRHARNLLSVEITDQVKPNIFVKIIHHAFEEHQNIALSQYMDLNQSTIKDRRQYVNRLIKEHKIEAVATQSYIETAGARINDLEFVVNLFGAFSIEAYSDVLKFGMTNLSNIIYSVRSKPENWLEDLTKWNNLVLNWFKLNIGSENSELINLVSLKELIALTIDGHIFFCFNEISYLDKILKILEDVSEQHNLILVIKTERM
jgi:hypothetical protein